MIRNQRHRTFEEYLKNIEVVIWDVDETMYYDEKVIVKTRQAYVEMLEKRGFGNLTKKIKDDFDALESTGKKWYQILVEKLGVSEVEVIGLAEAGFDKSKLVKKNPRLVKMLSSGKRKNFVVSNSSRRSVFAILKKLGFVKPESFFEEVFSIENMGGLKPNERVLLGITERANVGPEKVLMVGDSLIDDIIPAKNIGLLTSHVRCKRSEGEADFCVKDLDELLDIFETIR